VRVVDVLEQRRVVGLDLVRRDAQATSTRDRSHHVDD